MNKSIKVYGIKNCDTVKKAIVYLNGRDINYQFIDFRQNPISQQLLKKIVKSVGWELLINKRSTTYRSLSEEEKIGLKKRATFTAILLCIVFSYVYVKQVFN